ncbi:MAG: hypothetical protein HFH70_08235 [Lachnospiraceae bacterium]|nr:hypothetical protein [Lachnospiraceae bacterium]
MRNRKTIFYLTMAAMGTAMLLPGNYAAAKEVGEETEIENVQETVIHRWLGQNKVLYLIFQGKQQSLQFM